jgi:hypothetical protein
MAEQIPPALYTTARRLRHLRRHSPSVRFVEDTERMALSEAYEQSLRLILDEFCIAPGSQDWFALFYGPQGEDIDLQYPA